MKNDFYYRHILFLGLFALLMMVSFNVSSKEVTTKVHIDSFMIGCTEGVMRMVEEKNNVALDKIAHKKAMDHCMKILMQGSKPKFKRGKDVFQI